MESASIPTSGSLKLLGGGAEGEGRQQRPELLRLSPSVRLQGFVTRAAEAGLRAPEAVRIGLEHALCLADAARFAADVEAGRRLLVRAASKARPAQAMPPEQAAYVRRLATRRPIPVLDVAAGLSVEVPGKILSRARGTISESSLREDVVDEMLAWEIAATLSARTMGEWALLHLLEDRRAA